jgi:hypothetical protein
VVSNLVHRDRQHPGAKLATRVVALEALAELEEDLLSQVFREVLAADLTPDEAEDALEVELDEALQRERIMGGEALALASREIRTPRPHSPTCGLHSPCFRLGNARTDLGRGHECSLPLQRPL